MLDDISPIAEQQETQVREDESTILKVLTQYRSESFMGKMTRQYKDKENLQVFNLRQDFSYKMPGQSSEFLPKQNRAIEQLTQFVTQTLIDLGQFFKVRKKPYAKDTLLSEDQMAAIILFYMRRMVDVPELGNLDGYAILGDLFKVGFLQSLPILKIDTVKIEKPVFHIERVEDKIDENGVLTEPKKRIKLIKENRKQTRLRWSVINPEHFIVDPTGDRLYEGCDYEIDYWKLLEVAQRHPDIYNVSAVKEFENKGTADASAPDHIQDETDRGQDETDGAQSYRNRLRVSEFYGTILNEDGTVMIKNGYAAMIEDTRVLVKPQKNPFLHGHSPFRYSAFLRTPFSVHHQALADAITCLNKAINELFNFELDAGLRAVFGVTELRPDLLSNPETIAGGLKPAATLVLRPGVPPNRHAVEVIKTGTLPPDATFLHQLLQAEMLESSMQNELKVGSFPGREVKATEVVEASRSISTTLSGIAKVAETSLLNFILEDSFGNIVQSLDDDDWDELEPLLGPDVVAAIKTLSVEERFAALVGQYDFEVHGLSETLKQSSEFRKLMMLLQIIGGNTMLLESYAKEHSVDKLLMQIIKNLGVREDAIKLDENDQLLSALARLRNDEEGVNEGAVALQGALVPEVANQQTQDGSARDTEFPIGETSVPSEQGGLQL